MAATILSTSSPACCSQLCAGSQRRDCSEPIKRPRMMWRPLQGVALAWPRLTLPSRKRERSQAAPPRWHDLLHRCSAVEVFDLFQPEPLRGVHIGIIVWPSCEWKSRSLSRVELFHNVSSLFHAALGQQLQGPPGAGSAQRTLSRDRDRYSARRESHAGFSGEESIRPGS